MKTIGIIAEYNPFHRGHEAQLRLLRERYGPDCALVIALGGCFTQRGEAAVFSKYARAEAAVRCGADLVLEVSLPWAASSAEGFARGGVAVLRGAWKPWPSAARAGIWGGCRPSPPLRGTRALTAWCGRAFLPGSGTRPPGSGRWRPWPESPFRS